VSLGLHIPVWLDRNTLTGMRIVVMPAAIAARPGKAMGEDAAFQILAKGLAHIRLGAVVVALPVELTGTGEFMPSLEMFGNGLVDGQRDLADHVARAGADHAAAQDLAVAVGFGAVHGQRV